MDFDLRQLEAFVNVVDHGGFGAASRIMHLSQATVSERIANLENTIGMRLLDRHAREITVTFVGNRFYKLAKQLLEQRDAIAMELSEIAGVVRGSLNIGASTIPGEYILPRLLPDFSKEYPRIELNIRIHNSAEVMQFVRDGELEVGIVGAQPAGRHLVCEPLWADLLVLVVPAGHRLAAEKRIRMQDIAGESFITREQGSGTRKLMKQVMSEQGDDLPSAIFTLGSTTSVKEAVLAGVGVALISQRAVQREVDEGTLVALQVEGLRFERNFQLITARSRTQSPLCKRFTGFLVDSYRAGRG